MSNYDAAAAPAGDHAACYCNRWRQWMPLESVVKVYLCGPMSGLPDNNYPAFHAMAAELRAAGYEVENPAENEPPACGTWAGWMRLGITQLMRCDGIFLLPGWHKSKGATIERRLAGELGLHEIHQRREQE